MVDCEKLATQQIDLQYQQYVSQLPINDIPQKIGLNNEDYIQSISHEDTISIDVVDSSSSRLTIPSNYCFNLLYSAKLKPGALSTMLGFYTIACGGF